MFIFNLNVVFTMNFLKGATIRVRFSPGLLSSDQDFPESNLITADHVGKTWFSTELIALGF
jgi:hypothetical protein